MAQAIGVPVGRLATPLVAHTTLEIFCCAIFFSFVFNQYFSHVYLKQYSMKEFNEYMKYRRAWDAGIFKSWSLLELSNNFSYPFNQEISPPPSIFKDLEGQLPRTLLRRMRNHSIPLYQYTKSRFTNSTTPRVLVQEDQFQPYI